MNKTRTLAILVFDDVEVLDFCGPFEVFSVANRFTDPPAFNVLTVAERAGPAAGRKSLWPDCSSITSITWSITCAKCWAGGKARRHEMGATPGCRPD